MPAHSENFPWPSYYGNYSYFEREMSRHSRVATLRPIGNGVYDLLRTQGDTLRVFVCECYAFGIAEYFETIEKIGRLDAIIISSMWCGYSANAKKQCREDRVGLFKIGEFMSALNHAAYWER